MYELGFSEHSYMCLLLNNEFFLFVGCTSLVLANTAPCASCYFNTFSYFSIFWPLLLSLRGEGGTTAKKTSAFAGYSVSGDVSYQPFISLFFPADLKGEALTAEQMDFE